MRLNRRGQVPELATVLEVILVIFIFIAVFRMVGNARDNHLPIDQFQVRELALTRTALDLFGHSSVFYPLLPGEAVTTKASFNRPEATIGESHAVYLTILPESSAPEIPANGFMPLEVSGGVVRSGDSLNGRSRHLEIPCFADAPKKIAVIPENAAAIGIVAQLVAKDQKKFLPSSEQVDDLLTSKELRNAITAQADAVLTIRAEAGTSILAYTNEPWGCRVVNALVPGIGPTDPGIDAAVIPKPHDKATVELIIGTDGKDVPMLADGLYAAFI